MRPVGESAADYAIGFGLDQMDFIVAMYTGADGPADANISPLDVDDLGGLPPTLIHGGRARPASRLRRAVRRTTRHARVPVELFVGAGHLHGTPGITAAFAGAREWQEQHAHYLALAYNTELVRLAG